MSADVPRPRCWGCTPTGSGELRLDVRAGAAPCVETPTCRAALPNSRPAGVVGPAQGGCSVEPAPLLGDAAVRGCRAVGVLLVGRRLPGAVIKPLGGQVVDGNGVAPGTGATRPCPTPTSNPPTPPATSGPLSPGARPSAASTWSPVTRRCRCPSGTAPTPATGEATRPGRSLTATATPGRSCSTSTPTRTCTPPRSPPAGST